VLVAEDNADMREYLVRLLTPRWVVEAVGNGQQALESAVRCPPDLILTDAMMPVMDGVRLLRALRSNAKTSTVPVVMLSARAGEEAVLAGLDTGADDYVVKPFSARELLSRVATHLDLARLRQYAASVANELVQTRAVLQDEIARGQAEHGPH
jgi:DNA-binding response OmpR family regulator